MAFIKTPFYFDSNDYGDISGVYIRVLYGEEEGGVFNCSLLDTAVVSGF